METNREAQQTELSGDLLVFEAPSVVLGFRALASVQSEEVTGPIQLIDASPSGGGRFVILIKGKSKRLHEILKGMREAVTSEAGHAEPVDHEVIEEANAAILEAAYSLLPQKLSVSLLVVETETASAMFAAAQILTEQQKLTPLEIKIRKSGSHGAYAFFTGPSEKCVLASEDLKTRFKNAVREIKTGVFENPNEMVKSLFEGA